MVSGMENLCSGAASVDSATLLETGRTPTDALPWAEVTLNVLRPQLVPQRSLARPDAHRGMLTPAVLAAPLQQVSRSHLEQSHRPLERAAYPPH